MMMKKIIDKRLDKVLIKRNLNIGKKVKPNKMRRFRMRIRMMVKKKLKIIKEEKIRIRGDIQTDSTKIKQITI